MLDLLAAISSVDPPSVVAWAVLVFAAGMYPVGIMLGGSCSPCCTPSTQCTTCTEGELPDTLTVTFNGLADRTPGPDLITLGFSASFGGGASAKVTSPGGDPATDKGPISAVSLTSGGSGYAQLGRVDPTLTISGGSGSGATFTPSLTSSNDAFGIPSWALASVGFSGGTGYVDGEALTVAAAEGDTEAAGASVVVNTTRTQPTITASASGGSGATFNVSLFQYYGEQKWGIDSVAVTNGGSGYADGAQITFTPEAGTTTEQEAYATAIVGRTQPTVTASASGGTGAALSVTLSQETDWYTNQPYWVVSSVSVSNGGSGYTDGDPVTFTVTDGASQYQASATISVTDGEITGVNLDYYGGGYYYKSTGIITGVNFGYWGGVGSYFKDDGIPTGVTVTSGGQYYREDASAQPYVASVTVSVSSQAAPSNGTGATLTAEVESSTSSPDFGKIKSVSVANGGNNYLAWQWRNTKCCGWYWNGKPVVLKRNNGGGTCSYSHAMCGGWNNRGATGLVSLQYNGPNTPPTIGLITEMSSETNNATQCNTSFTASGNVTNCANWSNVTFSASGGATATVSAGGEYDEEYKSGWCHPCCQGEESFDPEITVSIQSAQNGLHDVHVPSGNYVLSYNGYFGGWVFGYRSGGYDFVAFLGLGLCEDHCDQCIKKCTVVAQCSLNVVGGGWMHAAELDMRTCYDYTPGLVYDSPEYRQAKCEALCTHVAPGCRPTGTFNFFRVSWSANFSAAGCPNCCEANGNRLSPYAYSQTPVEHRNVFVMTVQD